MERTKPDPVEIPSALPGFEDDDAREKLLLENASDELEKAVDEESIDIKNPAAEQNKRRWRMLRTFASFAVFLCLLVVGIAWFFGMGWFSKPQTQAVNRSGLKDAQNPPATEDEKLKMALSMIAAPSPTSVTAVASDGKPILEENTPNPGNPDLNANVSGLSPATIDQGKQTQIGERDSYYLQRAIEGSTNNVTPHSSSKVAVAGNETRNILVSKAADTDGALGRSLFFGISKKGVNEGVIHKTTGSEISHTTPPKAALLSQIPFGTLLPVRLIGSIYTLRNSGGFVRMELTRAVEGKGYAYPAGTMIVGNVRGGDSVRAFVNIVGLIDPASGELVRFSGELLGRDGSSGIEGKRRNLTSQWSRFFRGMKDTAESVLGSVGALRSGGTVILSEPIRRGTESVTGDLSGAILKNEREDSFLEVAAGSNGYVLVTGLPENSSTATSRPTPEAAKE